MLFYVQNYVTLNVQSLPAYQRGVSIFAIVASRDAECRGLYPKHALSRNCLSLNALLMQDDLGNKSSNGGVASLRVSVIMRNRSHNAPVEAGSLAA